MAEKQVTLKTARRSAQEILEQVIQNGHEELNRSTHALAFSGVAGGMTMGLTGLGVAIAKSTLGNGQWQEIVAYALYPIGFIAVIIGRAQLFTENTLYPVIIVLDEHRRVLSMMRLWATVFWSNVFGAVLFSILTVRVPSLLPAYREALMALGVAALGTTTGHIFWSGVIGGWIIALVAWMVSASHWTIGQIAIIWMLTYMVGIGRFAHCIATSGEILAAVAGGMTTVDAYLHWLLFATLGNIIGGVTIVSLLNYGQVKAGESE